MPHGGKDLNNPKKILEYAILAEKSGWDGFFIWDSLSMYCVDPWITLAAIAVKTEKIKMGVMVTPVARRRPWKLAKEIISLDNLSNGRVIFGAGLGDDVVFKPYGEGEDKKHRAEKLDEGLVILDQLLKGEKVNFQGKYFNLTDIQYESSVQKPRVPIWIGGLWPNKGPFKRAAKWDGMMPHTVRSVKRGERLEINEIKEIMKYIADHRKDSIDNFEMVMLSYLPKEKELALELVKSYYEVGVKWWVESVLEWEAETLEDVKERIISGPPEY
jgi:alkanesulfonate monooxygenase SsuD/methylene tetrahydromethanopterin reductase-like flavin-dependent oxidoreductase (luciferase family)